MQKLKPTIYLFNTSIATTAGLDYSLEATTARHARDLLAYHGGPIVSAIGHQATADALSQILGREVRVNRIAAEMEPGDVAVVLKLRGRLPEGQILTRDELEAIGFDLLLLTARCPIREWERHARGVFPLWSRAEWSENGARRVGFVVPSVAGWPPAAIQEDTDSRPLFLALEVAATLIEHGERGRNVFTQVGFDDLVVLDPSLD